MLVGYSYFFPYHIEYCFKLEMNSTWTIMVYASSSDGGKTYHYRIKTDQGHTIQSDHIHLPSSSCTFNEGLRILRVRSPIDGSWCDLLEEHLEEMDHIYRKMLID